MNRISFAKAGGAYPVAAGDPVYPVKFTGSFFLG